LSRVWDAGVEGERVGVHELSRCRVSSPLLRDTKASSPAVLGGVMGKTKDGWGYR
jgi:hypothetical protein